MDHEKIVNSSDAIISDDALAALLDRSIQLNTVGERGERGKEGKHSDVFRVIKEQDSDGKVLQTIDGTTDESRHSDSNSSGLPADDNSIMD